MEALTMPLSRVRDRESIDEILMYAVKHGASDIFFITDVQVRAEIHGVFKNVTRYAANIECIKRIVANICGGQGVLATLGSGQPVDSSYDIAVKDKETLAVEHYRFRVNAVKTYEGYTLTMRSLPSIPPTVEQIGLEPELVEAFHGHKKGLAIVSGATGSGKSTLLASINRNNLENTDNGINLVTIEQPIEYVFDKLVLPESIKSQIEVGNGIPTFYHGLKNALRMKPNHIMIGETRDYETFQAMVASSRTGHFTTTTVHTSNVAGIMPRLIDLCPPETQKDNLMGMIDETKVLCYQELLIKKDGSGRVPCKEYLIFNEEVRNYLSANHHNILSAGKTMIEEYGQPFRVNYERLKEEGVI